MSSLVEKFSTPGNCRTPDCEVALVLQEQSTKFYVCKHTLVKESDYFEKMFYGEGNFRETDTNTVELQDVTRSELLTFLTWLTQHPFKPIPSDTCSLCALIFLSDRFMCATLEEQLLSRLTNELTFELTTAETKLQLLEAADKPKGKEGSILAACIRLCANLDIHRLSALTDKISSSSLAATYAMVGKTMSERFSTLIGDVNSHNCNRSTGLLRSRRRLAGNKITCSIDCRFCDHSQKITGLEPVAFGKIKQIGSEKKLLLS